MKIEIENTTATRISLSCTIEPGELKGDRDKIVRKYLATKAIPGFRKGRVPRDTIEKTFAGDIFKDTLNAAIPACYEKAVKERELAVFELVEFTETKPQEDGSVIFTVILDLEPEFELPDYEGIPVDNQDTAITDEQIEEELKKIRRGMASFNDFAEDTVSEKDDMVSITFEGTIEGEPLETVIPEAASFGKKQLSWCTVGSDYYIIPGLAKELEGKKVGDTGRLTVAFPEDFYKEELRGKTVDYTYTLKEGRHLALPEMDEAFLEKLHVKSEDELRTRIRAFLEDNAKEQDKQRRTHQIIDFLVKATPFDLPQALLERATEDALNRLIQYSMRQGASKEDLAAERENLLDTARESAEANMRASFIIGRITKKLELTLTTEEFNAFLYSFFTRERMTEAQMKKVMKDLDQTRRIYSEALRVKVLDTLLERAKPTDSVSA